MTDFFFFKLLALIGYDKYNDMAQTKNMEGCDVNVQSKQIKHFIKPVKGDHILDSVNHIVQ